MTTDHHALISEEIKEVSADQSRQNTRQEPTGDRSTEIAALLIDRLRLVDVCTMRHGPNYINIQFSESERDFIINTLAAAPDMLAALQECASRCRYDGDLWDNQGLESRRDASWEAMRMAEAAIAKATGDQS